jgi:hypothetical protein
VCEKEQQLTREWVAMGFELTPEEKRRWKKLIRHMKRCAICKQTNKEV